MYKIGELSKLSKLSVKTLRYYDQEGLLSPDKIDNFTGYRYYSPSKLSDCYKILTLKELGFRLDEIKVYLNLPKEQLSKLIQKKELELQELQKQTQKRIDTLRALQTALQEEKNMFDIIIRKSDKIRIAYDRRIIHAQADIETIFQEIRSKIPEKLCGTRTVLIDFETEFKTEGFDTGFGIEITGSLPTKCGVCEKIIHFTEDTANLICKAEDYENAVTTLQKYVLDNNYQIVGAIYKITYPDDTVEIKLPITKLDSFDSGKNESIDIPFENDDRVIGHWETIDYLPCKEMFHPEKRKSNITNTIKELYFLPNGEPYWCFGWTKGLLLSVCGYPKTCCQNRYTIEETPNGTFMFVEFKTSNYFRGGKPDIWILKKTDSKGYQKEDILIVDEIPNTPACDERVLGKWNVCDFVATIDIFNPNHFHSFLPYEDLFWRQAEFMSDGVMQNRFKKSGTNEIYLDSSETWRWVTGNVICNPQSTVSMYIIKKFSDVEYLFIQWKSGDYCYGGKEPGWYVFQK